MAGKAGGQTGGGQDEIQKNLMQEMTGSKQEDRKHYSKVFVLQLMHCMCFKKQTKKSFKFRYLYFMSVSVLSTDRPCSYRALLQTDPSPLRLVTFLSSGSGPLSSTIPASTSFSVYIMARLTSRNFKRRNTNSRHQPK